MLNFKQSALEFVVKHNCASYAPVELIEKAMERGACEALNFASAKVLIARVELKEKREKNFGL